MEDEMGFQTLFEYKSDPEDPTPVKYKIDNKEVQYDIQAVLVVLLLEEVIFLNDHWWMSTTRDSRFFKEPLENPWPEEACNTVSLNVNCSDVFAWGCSDAEECTYRELKDVFDHWEKDPVWGGAIWCIKKRNQMPQKPVYKRIMEAGIWNLDEIVTKSEEQ